jgi:RNA polymerase sigma-54 factor
MEQRLLQSPQMIQAMQILQLSSQELLDRMQQELVENPFLELAEGERPEGSEPPETPVAPDTGEGSSADEARLSSMVSELEHYSRNGDDRGRVTAAGQEESDRKQEAMANTPDSGRTLAEELSEELAFLELDPRGRRICEQILYSLDDRGYLIGTHEDVAREASVPEEEPVTLAEVEVWLTELRHLSHPAIGARDLKESLKLQLAASWHEDPLLAAIVENHLEDLEHNRLPRVARVTGRSMEDVKEAVAVLKRLDPHPGAGYGDSRATVIAPDVVVEEQDGEYVVRLERARLPRLTLSEAYKEFLRAAKEEKREGAAREWIKKRMESARWFIEAVEQRANTLERVAKSVFARQKGFLDRGVEGLTPLRMQEVADEVHVHISTVSRAVAGKYAQTPRGIFPLKYFFTSGTTSQTGEVQSQQSIQQRIAQLVAAEDPQKPLSDEELAALLEEKEQIRIARRTVTKYRKALRIPSSSERKHF